jgi:nucleoside-diphosphate-sugar epimerase
MTVLITGSTGLTGGFLLSKIANLHPNLQIMCLVRPSSNYDHLNLLPLDLRYYQGDSADSRTWDALLSQHNFDTIIHLVQLRQVPTLISSLNQTRQQPRLIIIGTTGVYSKYNQYSSEYKQAEQCLFQYQGSYCLLRPTMIYGTSQDKNLHKLIKFCCCYHFFPIFGDGKNLMQPVHAEDLAQALLSVWQSPHIQGTYDISGGTVTTFRDLIILISKLLEKNIYQPSFPLYLGITLASLSEKILGNLSPVRKEQILRLQEDKAYPYTDAYQDFGFAPRSLEAGLRDEINLMKDQRLI